MVLVAADRVGPEAAHWAPTARAAHYASSSDAGGNNGGGGAKKGEEDIESTVLNDVVTRLRSPRLHKYRRTLRVCLGRKWSSWTSRHSRRRRSLRGGKYSRLSRSSGGKWASMICRRHRLLRRPLVRPRRRPRLLLGARLVPVVGYPRRERS